jgi:hypothetical protein
VDFAIALAVFPRHLHRRAEGRSPVSRWSAGKGCFASSRSPRSEGVTAILLFILAGVAAFPAVR